MRERVVRFLRRESKYNRFVNAGRIYGYFMRSQALYDTLQSLSGSKYSSLCLDFDEDDIPGVVVHDKLLDSAD